MKLLHVALKAEAKPLIEYFKLKCITTKPYKVYKRDDIVLAICGIGREKTKLHLKDIFDKYPFKIAISVGIAGCKYKEIKIGSFFCTNQKLKDIRFATITTVDKALDTSNSLKTTLVDMESDSFIFTCREFLNEKEIFVLKIVSDHLETTIPKKEFVWKIIEKNLKNISKIVNLKN
jgi:purine-nucleoside phosphorylase